MTAKPKNVPITRENMTQRSDPEQEALMAMKADLQTMVEHLLSCDYTSAYIKGWIAGAHWLRITQTYMLHKDVYHGVDR